jgi:hypothetical protein
MEPGTNGRLSSSVSSRCNSDTSAPVSAAGISDDTGRDRQIIRISEVSLYTACSVHNDNINSIISSPVDSVYDNSAYETIPDDSVYDSSAHETDPDDSVYEAVNTSDIHSHAGHHSNMVGAQIGL